jgi:hypothetical protein
MWVVEGKDRPGENRGRAGHLAGARVGEDLLAVQRSGRLAAAERDPPGRAVVDNGEAWALVRYRGLPAGQGGAVEVAERFPVDNELRRVLFQATSSSSRLSEPGSLDRPPGQHPKKRAETPPFYHPPAPSFLSSCRIPSSAARLIPESRIPP